MYGNEYTNAESARKNLYIGADIKLNPNIKLSIKELDTIVNNLNNERFKNLDDLKVIGKLIKFNSEIENPCDYFNTICNFNNNYEYDECKKNI